MTFLDEVRTACQYNGVDSFPLLKQCILNHIAAHNLSAISETIPLDDLVAAEVRGCRTALVYRAFGAEGLHLDFEYKGNQLHLTLNAAELIKRL